LIGGVPSRQLRERLGAEHGFEPRQRFVLDLSSGVASEQRDSRSTAGRKSRVVERAKGAVDDVAPALVAGVDRERGGRMPTGPPPIARARAPSFDTA
jgi:hypothetical protein